MRFFSVGALLALVSCHSSVAQHLRGLQQDSVYAIPVPDTDTLDPIFSGLAIPDDAADVGVWTPVRPWPVVSIHTAIMPDGRLVTYGASPTENVQDGRVFVFWDPLKGFSDDAFYQSPNAADVDSFCSSGVLLQDGQFLTSGGAADRGGGSSIESSLLNYQTTTAVRTADLNYARWYGTMTKLPDGRALMTGGARPYVTNGWTDVVGTADRVSSTPEVFSESEGWTALPGGYSLDAFGSENNRYWYPRQWVSPTGSIFGISTDKIWELSIDGFDTSVRTIGDFKTKPDNTLTPNVGPTSTAVMFAPGQILQVGGNGYANGYASPSSNKATIFDINDIGRGNVGVLETSPMAFPRQWANAVVLHDGQVLVTGGTRYANSGGTNSVLESEMWNPQSGEWTTTASAAVLRVYHSTAALLPNGAVFAGGGGIPGPVTNKNAEVFLPPYLFQKQGTTSIRAERPRILSVSSNAVGYRDTVKLELLASTISQVSLIALPAVTHSFDSNSRRMTLPFATTPVGIDVQMPASPNLAPPGYYYLSVLDSFGVPSTSVILGIDAASPLPPSPPPATLPEITGPFVASMTATFENPDGGAWQRIFDFGNGPAQDNVLLSQRGRSNDLTFHIWRDGVQYDVTAPGAIVAGESAEWRCGVSASGLMWIEKNGVRLVQGQGIVPADVIRANKYIGQSNWPWDAPLIGQVTGFSLVNTVVAPPPPPPPAPTPPAPTPPPPPPATLPEITGSFVASMTATFENPDGGAWQRIFDFGNGPAQDNVLLSQRGRSNDLTFHIWRDGVQYDVTAPGAIVAGESAEWRCGVSASGLMWIEKNGVRLVQGQGIVPADVIRANKYIGQSNWPWDAPLIGQVTGFSLVNTVVAPPPPPPPAPTPPAPPPATLPEITGSFVASMTATFENPDGGAWQRIFDFGNGPAQDNVLLSQRGRSNDLTFHIWRGGVQYDVTAPGAIVAGESAEWRCGVSASGLMWIEKNGVRLVQGQGIVPADVIRANKYIGQSNWPWDAPLIGQVTGFSLVNTVVAPPPPPPPAPTPPAPPPATLPEITGSFVASMTATFENPDGGAWQRIFDFGNGPAQDNVLLSQRGRSNDLTFHIWRGGVQYDVTAPGAIVAGESAEWRCGVSASGLMWIEKNGVRLVQGQGIVPADVIRANKYIGQSNWPWDAPLIGQVTGFSLVNTA